MKKKYLTPTMESFHMDTPLLHNVSINAYRDGGKKSFGDTDEDEDETEDNTKNWWNR